MAAILQTTFQIIIIVIIIIIIIIIVWKCLYFDSNFAEIYPQGSCQQYYYWFR